MERLAQFSSVSQSCPPPCDPMDCIACWVPLCPWDLPGKNTGVGSHSLLQGISPTQGLNPSFLYCRQILYCLSHQGWWISYSLAITNPHSAFVRIRKRFRLQGFSDSSVGKGSACNAGTWVGKIMGLQRIRHDWATFTSPVGGCNPNLGLATWTAGCRLLPLTPCPDKLVQKTTYTTILSVVDQYKKLWSNMKNFVPINLTIYTND